MAKMVGYACSIKLSWMRKAVELKEAGVNETTFKESMNEYLSYEIDSPTRLRKSREILMNVWFYENKNEQVSNFRKDALVMLKRSPDDEVAIFYTMLCATYPVFTEVSSTMARLFQFKDEITTLELKQKLYDSWGERGTLEATSRRITLTMKELHILSASTRGKYTMTKQQIKSPSVVNFCLYVMMSIEQNTYTTFVELADYRLLFPFEYKVSKEALIEDERFVMSNFGGETPVSIRE